MLDPPTQNRPFADKRDKVGMDGVPKNSTNTTLLCCTTRELIVRLFYLLTKIVYKPTVKTKYSLGENIAKVQTYLSNLNEDRKLCMNLVCISNSIITSFTKFSWTIF